MNYLTQPPSNTSSADHVDVGLALTARYSRIPRNALELAGVSDTGRYLYAWLYQSPSRDVVPGLLRVGYGGLAEEIGWTRRKVQEHLRELAGHVLVDEPARVVFILGAIRADPPRNPKQISAMARQFAQIPTCAATAAAMSELEATIKNSDKSLMDKWREFDCIRNSFVNSTPNSNYQTPTPTPIQTLTPTPTPSALTRGRARALKSVPDPKNEEKDGSDENASSSPDARIGVIARSVVRDFPKSDLDYKVEVLIIRCQENGIRGTTRRQALAELGSVGVKVA